MKLIADFGNTLQKLAIFDGNGLVSISRFDIITAQQLSEFIIINGPFKSAILSSVIEVQDDIMSLFLQIPFFIELSHQTPLPVKLFYKTPETLGRDRIAAAVAGNFLYHSKDVLVIDAGTCITFDLVTKNSEYIGGSIHPGINMQFTALHTFTGKLPLVNRKEYTELTGKTTEESILSGVLLGTSASVQGMINEYNNRYPGLIVLITGGDSAYLVNNLKSHIFALPNLILEGLNIILDFNETEKPG
jgi:type III pantothenate kinase